MKYFKNKNKLMCLQHVDTTKQFTLQITLKTVAAKGGFFKVTLIVKMETWND